MARGHQESVMDRVLETLRSGDWLTRERVRLVAAALLIASAAGFLFLVVTAHGSVDLQGRPLGTDFSNVYAAGTFVNEGNVAAPFDPMQQFERERAIFGDDTQFYGWHYPPYFLFIASALALMPYGLALAVWQTVTLGLYLLVIRTITADLSAANRGDRFLWLLLALAFPSVLINIGHGQNGFLTAALMGGALVVLDRRPIFAGILFALLIYKPQYGLLLPVLLGISGRWRCFASAAVTVIALTIATTLAFGTSVWHAFAEFSEFTRTVVLEQGNTGWYKIQSVFSWVRMWGAPVPFAYVLQAIITLAIAIALARLWRRTASFPLKAAALCLGTILATPYSFDYDMMVLVPAIAFVAVDGFERGFGPWQKTALAALWLVPLIARSVAQVSMIPLGVPAMGAMFFFILRRADPDPALPGAFSGSTMVAGSGEPSRRHVVAPNRGVMTLPR
jgi:alpha-1,2-mannosyltransferase